MKPLIIDAQSNTLLTDFDIHLFNTGRHFHLHYKLGAHVVERAGVKGVFFAVWAPNAEAVSVIGNFNYWTTDSHKLTVRWDQSGIWEGFFEGISAGEAYKYGIFTKTGEYMEKADPVGFFCETPPKTASIVWQDFYAWKDQAWLDHRKKAATLPKPFSVYEVHLGSWRRKCEEGNRSLTYRELAEQLVPYVRDSGFTHVEFMPVMEHPFYGSWGYQITGYFAPTGRYGTPEDFKFLVDSFHLAGIGVILDWVPSHFPGDAHGLFRFDGTHLYEHADFRKGFHPDWSSYIYNFGRNEVRSFLISNAFYWLEEFHIDGLRVDAVASMLYLDYSRKSGEWIPNELGGNENLEAISFLKELNIEVYREFPDVVTIAEESTAWTGISRPTYSGGLGFGQKWMMGWMHDTLCYFKNDPVYRSFHQSDLTFSMVYAFTENFMLPLSHDEVVHGKGSIISRMPGDEWQRFANLRLLFGYMFTHPGTKLLFMGGEFGQTTEWNHESSLDWHLLENCKTHQGIWACVRDLNFLLKSEPALYRFPFDDRGFEWIDYSDRENSVISYLRKDENPENALLVVFNMTPQVRYDYRVGVHLPGAWQCVFNSDNPIYGGSGVSDEHIIETVRGHYHGRNFSINITLPPLAVVIFELQAFDSIQVYETKNK